MREPKPAGRVDIRLRMAGVAAMGQGSFESQRKQIYGHLTHGNRAAKNLAFPKGDF